jgi:3-carboxy-cis,cis-muconate cycloisomerase
LSPDLLFSSIITTDELLQVTGDQSWLQAMLDAEAALARAEAGAGVIASEAAGAIAECCRAERFDAGELGRAARDGGNPVIPLVRALTAAVPAPARDWVHFGATSQDILDTAAVLIARRGTTIVAGHLAGLADACAALAERHRRTIMTGRTLLQPALPITFGFKAAEWLVDVTDCRLDLMEAVDRLPAQFGGAVGTLAALGDDGPAVGAAFARELGLPPAVMPWHAARQRTARFAGTLAALSGTAAKIAGDVALLMQAEVGEAREPAAAGRGGSSTLPHKRNPVGAAAVGAAARRTAALASVFYGALAGEHERSVSAWPAEWQSLSEMLTLAGGAAARVRDTIAGLEVDAEAMAANVQRFGGMLIAERISFALASRLGRAAARDSVAAAGRRAVDTTAEALGAALLEDPSVAAALAGSDLERLLDPAGYLGSTNAWIDRALAHHRRVGIGAA